MGQRLCRSVAQLLAVYWVCVPLVQAQSVSTFNLPSQPLADALRTVARQTNTNVLFDAEIVAGYQAPAVNARLTINEVLSRLLMKTAVRYEFINDDTIVLRPNAAVRNPDVSASAPATAAAEVPIPDSSSRDVATGQVSLEEVTVTAQRRSERLQTVPLAISTMDARMMEQLGIGATVDLPLVAPGVVFFPSTGGAGIAIRGVASSVNGGDETANAVYIDGVYQAAAPALLFSFNNIERIEVLKGPQGTLFGRNATGGVIQIVTREPQREAALGIEVGFGSHDLYEGKFYGSTGLGDSAAADLSIYYQDQRDGWGTNLVSGEDAYEGKSLAARSKWRMELGEGSEVGLSATFIDTNPISLSAIGLVPGTRGAAGNVSRGFWNSETNLDAHYETRQRSAALTFNHDFGWARLVNIASHSIVEVEDLLDQDAGPLPLIDAYFHREVPTSTEELQLLSPQQSATNWIAGLFYYRNREGYEPNPVTVSGSVVESLGGLSMLRSRQRTESFAAYGQLTQPVTDATKLTMGARYTVDRRDFAASRVTGLATTPEVVPKRSQDDSKFTWRLAVDHAFNADVLAYASYSRGFKSGFFNINCFPTPGNACDPVRPQTLDAYEFGLKAEFLERRLRINSAAYFYDFDDIQLRKVEDGTTRTLNAARAKMRGIDIDAEAVPFKNFAVRAAIAYLDGEYTSFIAAPFFDPAPSGNGMIGFSGDASGNALMYAPEWAFTLQPIYVIHAPRGELSLTAAYSYTDTIHWDPQQRLQQRPHHLINAQIGWKSASNGWTVRIWGRNLANEKIFGRADPTLAGDVYFAAPPRTYGIHFGWALR